MRNEIVSAYLKGWDRMSEAFLRIMKLYPVRHALQWTPPIRTVTPWVSGELEGLRESLSESNSGRKSTEKTSALLSELKGLWQKGLVERNAWFSFPGALPFPRNDADKYFNDHPNKGLKSLDS